MNIDVQVIPHAEQRYNTCGDWFFDADYGVLHIRVSCLNNWKYESLIAMHEQQEAIRSGRLHVLKR